MKDAFDVNQGHGDHIGTVNGYDSNGDFIAKYIPETIQSADMVLKTKGAVECTSEDGRSRKPFILLGDKKGPVRLMGMIAVIETGEKNELCSFYPECDGAPVEVRLTAIHEWAAGVEATLEGTVLGDAERHVAFFDTRYVLNKERYKVGETYTFTLSAFAYSVDVVPEDEREFRMYGDDAVEHRRRLGEEPEYEEDGSVKPVVYSMAKMVAFFQTSEAYPDDAEFQSPVFNAPVEFRKFDTDFYMIEIAIAREEEDVKIPLVARKKLFTREPAKDDPVRGWLWVQGCLAGGNYGKNA